MAYIYQITNDINGKIYIGKTEYSVEKRFKEHCTDAFKERNFNRPLYAAMRKYGIEHFHIEILEETDEAEIREVYWIEQKQSFKKGYNATKGGDGKKYLDYDLIVSTYEEYQNIAYTAKYLNISVDSVKTALESKHIAIKSSGSVNKEQYGKTIKMFDKEKNQYIQSFVCLRDAARYLIDNHIANSQNLQGIVVHIRNCANQKRKTAYGYIWKWQ